MAFQPGQSGNPLGRSKTKPYQEALMRVLLREDGDIPQGKTNLDRVVSTHLTVALGGDVSALKDIADRLDGKPAQAIIGDVDLPLAVRIITGVPRQGRDDRDDT